MVRTPVSHYRLSRYTDNVFYQWIFSPNLPVPVPNAGSMRRRIFFRINCASEGRRISFLEILPLDIDVSQTSFIQT